MPKKLTAKQMQDIQTAALSVPVDHDAMEKHPISWRHRAALIAGKPAGEDLREFRLMLQLTQQAFAAGLGISIGTLRNWEQDVRHPDGPAIALLRLVARHPRLLLRELVPAARAG